LACDQCLTLRKARALEQPERERRLLQGVAAFALVRRLVLCLVEKYPVAEEEMSSP
jgi:hypothetical protein